MNFLTENLRFSFLYDGIPAAQCPHTVEQRQDGDTLTTVYRFENGLTVTNRAKKYPAFGAYEWVNILENTSDTPTGIVSRLWDCDVTLPMAHEEPKGWVAYAPDPKTATKIDAPQGSTWRPDEFYCDVDLMDSNARPNHITVGETKSYAASGGRSCEKQAPFFDIRKENCGILAAIGWTGQWNCDITRDADSVTLRTGIEDTHFRLLAGEKIRTSSVVLMPYDGGMTNARNRWRRLLKAHFSLIGQPGRDEYGPLCANVWGGMPTADVLDRIRTIREQKSPFEYVWMDAGWYGESTLPTPDEFEGDWGMHTGEWVVSPKIHPGGLRDVSRAVHEAGMKFLLWMEPERVIRSTPIVQAQPEYFLDTDGPGDNVLLNLGNPEAWSWCFETISSLIETLEIDGYRQDFNMSPLPYWRKRDGYDRRGITEIKHITGLYRLWDALLARFPHLLIDNCASGGRRIDIELLRRSIPLWRSDLQCPANFDDYAAQCHNLNFNAWMPYSGTGCGRIYDGYRMRSAYAAALATNFSFSAREPFADTPEKAAFLQQYLAEYKKVRPYFSGDFYPLTRYADQTDVWCAAQFDRPEQKDGMIQVFRREDAPYRQAEFRLGGIVRDAVYTLTDADTGASVTCTGAELESRGLTLELSQPRTAKLFFYTHT